jgi:Cytochrome c
MELQNGRQMKKGEKVLFGIVALLVAITVINFTVLESVRRNSEKPLFPILTHFVFSDEGLRGYGIYQHRDCYTCHRAVGSGTSMGISLDGLGSKHDVNYFYKFLTKPELTYGAKTMDHGAPPKDAAYVSALPESDLRAMSVFLSELRADQGSSSSFRPPAGDSSFIDAMIDMWAPDNWRSEYKDIRSWIRPNTQEEQHDSKH